MSYRERMQDIVNGLNGGITANHRVAIATLAHYSPELIDMGIEMDRLHDENERLTAIVNLIEIKTERDDLKQRVAKLEAELDGKNASDGSAMR